MPQLDLTTYPSQIFWLALSFSILYWFLSRICLPKLSKVFDDRENKISLSLEKAKENKLEALRLKDEYERNFAQAVKEKNLIITDAIKEINLMVERRISEHDLHLKKMIEASEVEIEEFKSRSLVDIRKIAIKATEEISANFFDIDPSKESIEKIIREQLSEDKNV